MDWKLVSAGAFAAVFAFGVMGSGPAHAADCVTDTPKDEITDEEAATLYECVKGKMAKGYAKSGLDVATDYTGWTQISTGPHVSGTHGGRYVLHWVNEIGAESYQKYEDMGGQIMPVGSIAVKESFGVSKKNGKVRPGPLFLMEKMEAGFNEETGDWKYTLMFPNGKIVGETNGEKGGKVAFCNECHVAVLEDQDAMFFPEEEYRAAAN